MSTITLLHRLYKETEGVKDRVKKRWSDSAFSMSHLGGDQPPWVMCHCYLCSSFFCLYLTNNPFHCFSQSWIAHTVEFWLHKFSPYISEEHLFNLPMSRVLAPTLSFPAWILAKDFHSAKAAFCPTCLFSTAFRLSASML